MTDDLLARAADLDAADPLAGLRDRFLAPATPTWSPTWTATRWAGRCAATAALLDEFVREQWAGRLIRGWTEGWLEWPLHARRPARRGRAGRRRRADGDRRLDDGAALQAGPGRGRRPARAGARVVLDTDNFPTDRYVLEGIAAERGLDLVWIDTDPATGITPDQVADGGRRGHRAGAVQPRRVPVGLARRRRGDQPDRPRGRRPGAVGPVPLGGLGAESSWTRGGSTSRSAAPTSTSTAARARRRSRYVRSGPAGRAAAADLGLDGAPGLVRDGPRLRAGAGVRALLSGTPPILAMVPLHANLDMLAEAGIAAVRAKSVLLTGYALDLADEWLAPLGVEVVSPRDPARRGGHVTLRRPGFEELLAAAVGRAACIPDYRRPDGLRIGPAPLSTSFAEVHRGLAALRDLLEKHGPHDRSPAAGWSPDSLWWDGPAAHGEALRRGRPARPPRCHWPTCPAGAGAGGCRARCCPGLVDAHVHSALVDLPTVRAGGIAYVWDLGGVPAGGGPGRPRNACRPFRRARS